MIVAIERASKRIFWCFEDRDKIEETRPLPDAVLREYREGNKMTWRWTIEIAHLDDLLGLMSVARDPLVLERTNRYGPDDTLPTYSITIYDDYIE